MEVSQARVLLLSSVATLGLGVTSLDAQKVSGAQITGHVIDKSTGEHLPGMTIAIKGTNLGLPPTTLVTSLSNISKLVRLPLSYAD